MERIEEIMEIEKEAISKIILYYWNDNYILSYAEQFAVFEYPKDKKQIKLLVDRLVDWYKKTYNKIWRSEYTLDKMSHQYTYRLLREVKELLKDVTID